MKKIAYIAVVALAVVACNKEEGAKIDSIKVVPETKTLYTDEALPELAVVLDPEDANVTVEWTSSDPELVTVSQKGELALTVEDIEEEEKVVTITAKAGGFLQLANSPSRDRLHGMKCLTSLKISDSKCLTETSERRVRKMQDISTSGEKSFRSHQVTTQR